MMKEYAAEAGLPPRLVLALPVPAPRLAGLWVALVTPIPLSMSVPLVQSLQHDAVSAEHDIDNYIEQPDGGLTGYRRAVALALGKERDGQVETTWASAGADADPLPSDPGWAGHRVYVDERTFASDVDPAHVWTIIEGIGGRNGWYSLPLAWSVRGWLDKLSGGAGLLRGRAASAPSGGRRGGGLVARGTDRARPPAPPAGGDARPGTGLAGALRGARRHRKPLPPAGDLLPQRPQRAALLAGRPSLPQHHLPGHVPQHHRGGPEALRRGKADAAEPGAGPPVPGNAANPVGCGEQKAF